MSDLISRELLLKSIDNIADLGGIWGRAFAAYKEAFKEFVKAMPSEEKTGRWKRNDNGTYSCDRCQSWITKEQHYYARYCIYCGAKMEVTE